MQLNFHCSDVSCDQSFQVPLLIMNLGNFCKVVVLRIRIVKIAQNARQSELSKRGIHMQFSWNSPFFHQIPSLTSLQTEHINSRTFGALLKPLGFLDLVGSGISFAPSCQSLCAEGGGGQVLVIAAIPAIPQKWGWWEGAGILISLFLFGNGWVGC